MSEYEVTLGIAQELSGSVMTLRNLPGSLRYFINKTALRYEIDIVLIDMSPSLGSINQNLFTTSDYFIVPMHPDYFSKMAINSLSNVIPKWDKWGQTAAAMTVLEGAEYPYNYGSPKFLGYVVQKYRPRGGYAPSAAFQEWIDQLETAVRDTLLPKLESCKLMLSEATYQKAGFSPEDPLLQMSDFNSLIARSQEHKVPIYELSDAQLEQVGIVLATTKKSMEMFRDLFTTGAERVIKLIDQHVA